MGWKAAKRAFVAALVVAGTVVVAGPGPAGAQQAPGVTSTTIDVGGMAGIENFVGQPYASGFDGVQAYFNYINAKGGVFNHKFRLVAKLDDQDSPSTDLIQARSLVEEKHVFAVLPVVVDNFSAGSYLASKGIPTFGWNINTQWASGNPTPGSAYPAGCNAVPGLPNQCTGKGAPNLFGQRGSFLCLDCPQEAPAFIAQQLGLKNVAVMAYTVPQSAQCATGMIAGFRKFGFNVVFSDTSIPITLANISSDADQMKSKNVQFVGTCMDIKGNAMIAQALQRAGVPNAKFYAPQGYDPQTLKKYGSQINGFYFGINFIPFETPNATPGMKLFTQQMKKLGKPINEQALSGWINADLLYKGIKAAGPNFTQASVVNAINTINGYTADGIEPPVNWGVDGHGIGHETCTAYVAVLNGKFRSVFGKPGQPFACTQEFPLPATFDSSTLYYRPPNPGEQLPSTATVPTSSPAVP